MMDAGGEERIGAIVDRRMRERLQERRRRLPVRGRIAFGQPLVRMDGGHHIARVPLALTDRAQDARKIVGIHLVPIGEGHLPRASLSDARAEDIDGSGSGRT